MNEIIIYTTEICPYCVRAKQLLERKGLQYTEIHVDNNDELREKMIQLSGRRTVPQLFINGKSIGGCDDLYQLEHSGELDKMLK